MIAREERVNQCENCGHSKRNKRHGMVCGLTNDDANFEGVCPQFVARRSNLAPQRAETTTSYDDTDDRISLQWFLVGIAILFVGLVYLFDVTKQTVFFVLSIGTIVLAATILLYAYGYLRHQNIQQPTRKELNCEEIVQFLRMQGYSSHLIDGDNWLSFRRNDDVYLIYYNHPYYALSYCLSAEIDLPTANVAAIWVMRKSFNVKVYVEQKSQSESPNKQLFRFSVEDIMTTTDNLQQSFETHIQMIEDAVQYFGYCNSEIRQCQDEQQQADDESPRQDIYLPEVRWMPEVLFKAVSEGSLTPTALTDENRIRAYIQRGVSSEEDIKEWDSFKINSVYNYGDYKLIIYQFPEPKFAQEAKYGAALMHIKTLKIAYYTLAMTHNGKWAYGSLSTECHNKYEEIETDDLDKFIEWILTHDKQVVVNRAPAKENPKTVN